LESEINKIAEKDTPNELIYITLAASSLTEVLLFCLEMGLVTTASSSRNLSIPEIGIIKGINRLLELGHTYSR
jgi:hypothetical protein